MNKNPLIEAFERAGQGHVFAFYDTLNTAEQKQLLEQAAEIDLAEVERLTATLLKPGAAVGVNLDGLAPAAYEPLPEKGGNALAWAEATALGEEALRAGRVAAFTVAGGQGTRLGFDGPKGSFGVTPVRQNSLFQVFAEKISAIGKRYGRSLHWFILTSHANYEPTVFFFQRHHYFSLAPMRIHFVIQGRMPAVDLQGRILMESKSTIALSPDGHGGSLRALARSGSLDLMAEKGIDILSYFQVDNPLVRAIDPAFIGWHLRSGSEMSSKMLVKAYPAEKVGVFCTQHGRQCVIEYSDLPKSYQEEIDPATGQLRYLAGSIAIHLLDVPFIRRLTAPDSGVALPFHRADKKIPTIDAQGQPVKPEKPNGVKFELFVFDALPFARNPLVIETSRADDFSPVKNAEGLDSPQTCRDDQIRQWVRWLRAAGEQVPTDASGLPPFRIEISPLFATDEKSFVEAWAGLEPKPAIAEGLVLTRPFDLPTPW